MAEKLNKVSFFYRILPEAVRANLFLYNISVLLLSIAAGFLCLILSVTAALMLAWIISEKLQAGIAGMSITLIFLSIAFIISAGVTLFLIIRNIRFKRSG